MTGEPGRAVRVRLLGEFDAWLGDDRLVVESARGRALLGYLALHDGQQRRERVAFVLWPDSSEAQARTNLRHLLHTLRQSVPELDRLVDATAQTLSWRRDETTWLDIAAFEAALADGSPEALAEAQALYRGDLLSGQYDDWLGDHRERLRERYIESLRDAMASAAQGGEHAEAVRLGRELVRREPLDERSHRLLIDAHVGAGDRAGAVRAYHQCVSTLRDELGIDPSVETVDAFEALSSGAPEVPTPDQAAPVSRARLVGRADEWSALSTWWHEAESGHPRLVLVTGEAGIGKTRLIEDLSVWCTRRGAAVAGGRSYSTEVELGLGLAVAWLRAPDMDRPVRWLTDNDRAVLGELVPELRPPDVELVPVDAAGQRRRFFDAFVRTIEAAGRPTLLVTDDAQWCDALSLQLIHYLVRREPSLPLLVVATARSEDLDRAHPLHLTVAGLHAIDRAGEIALSRLDQNATAELANDIRAAALDATAAAALHDDTEGNPLFIVEAVRAGWSGTGPKELTPKLQAVITSRLQLLTAPTSELLGVAAAVGREFSTAVLGRAAAVEDSQLVRALDELWRRGIISEGGVDSYDFTHGKIRDAAYARLGPAARRRNHARVAAALIDLHHDDEAAVSGEVARHFDLAGEVAPAIEWYSRAATEAQRRNAPAEAVRLLERSRQLVAELPDGAARVRHEMQTLAGSATPLGASEGWSSTRLAEVQRRALELAATHGGEVDPAILRSLAMTKLSADDFATARAVARQLRRTAEANGDLGLVVESDYLLGIAAFWAGDLGAARAHFADAIGGLQPEQAIDHFVRFGHDPRVVCLSRLANTLWLLGERQAAFDASAMAFATADQLDHPFSRALAHTFGALLAVDDGDAARCRFHVEQMTSKAEQHRPHRVASEAFLGYLEAVDGNTRVGIERIRGSIDASRSGDLAPGFGAVLARLHVAALAAVGDAARGRVVVEEALASSNARVWEPEFRRQLAAFMADLDEPGTEIDAELARAEAIGRRFGAVAVIQRIGETRRLLGAAGKLARVPGNA